jgi:hypothetical protein
MNSRFEASCCPSGSGVNAHRVEGVVHTPGGSSHPKSLRGVELLNIVPGRDASFFVFLRLQGRPQGRPEHRC